MAYYSAYPASYNPFGEYAEAEGSSSRPKRARSPSTFDTQQNFGGECFERIIKRPHLPYPTPTSSNHTTPSSSAHPSPYISSRPLQAEQQQQQPAFDLGSIDEDSSMMAVETEQQQQPLIEHNEEVMEESTMEPFADYSWQDDFGIPTSVSPPKSSPSYLQAHFAVSATPAVTPSGTPFGSPNHRSSTALPSASHFHHSYTPSVAHPLSHPKPSFPPLPSSIASPYRVSPKPLQPISRPHHHASLYSVDPRMECRACNQGISRGRWGHRAGCSES